MKEYIKPTPAKRPYHYRSCQLPFRQGPHPSSSGRGHQSYQNQGFVRRDGQRKFYFRRERGKLEPEPLRDTYIHHNSEIKNSRLFKFKRLPNSSPICKKLLKEARKTFPIAGRLTYFLKNLEKITKDSILSIVKGYSVDFKGCSKQRYNTPTHSTHGSMTQTISFMFRLPCQRLVK